MDCVGMEMEMKLMLGGNAGNARDVGMLGM